MEGTDTLHTDADWQEECWYALPAQPAKIFVNQVLSCDDPANVSLEHLRKEFVEIYFAVSSDD